MALLGTVLSHQTPSGGRVAHSGRCGLADRHPAPPCGAERTRCDPKAVWVRNAPHGSAQPRGDSRFRSITEAPAAACGHIALPPTSMTLRCNQKAIAALSERFVRIEFQWPRPDSPP